MFPESVENKMFSDSEEEEMMPCIIKLGELLQRLQEYMAKDLEAAAMSSELSESESDSDRPVELPQDYMAQFPYEAEQIISSGEKVEIVFLVKPKQRKRRHGGELIKTFNEKDLRTVWLEFRGKNYVAKAPKYLRMRTILYVFLTVLNLPVQEYLMVDDHLDAINENLTVQQTLIRVSRIYHH